MALTQEQIQLRLERIQALKTTTPYISREKREEWEQKNYEAFQKLDFQKDIIPIIKECYQIAITDTEYVLPFSDLVLKNVALITNKETMSITYKQWKSFKAYHNANCMLKLKGDNLKKLGL